MPQDIEQTKSRETLAEIKTQSDTVQSEHLITETDMASIVTSMLSGTGMVDLDNTETQMLFEILSIYRSVQQVVLIEKMAEM